MKITYQNRVLYDGRRTEPTMLFPGLEGYEVTHTVDEQRAMIRDAITATAGDTLSLLGTASDGAQLLLFHLAKLVQGLSVANSLAKVRDATADFEPLAAAFLAKVEAGDVRLPFQLKGEAAVLAEVEARATAVTDALTASQGG